MKQPEPKPRTRRSRWVRFGVGGLLLGLLGLIAIGIAGAYAYQNRTGLTNQILRQTFSAFDAQVGEIEITRTGIDIGQITFRDPKSQAQILVVDSVTWRPAWSKVSSGDLGRFSLTGARMNATAEQLRSWMTSNAPDVLEPKPAVASSSFSLPSLLISSSEIRDVSVNIQGDAKTPSLSFHLEHTVEGLDLQEVDLPKLARTTLKITDLAITPPMGDPLTVPELTAVAGLRPDDGMIQIDLLQLRGARIRLTPLLREWALQFAAAPDAEPSPPLNLPWLKGVVVKKLNVDDGEFRVEVGALGAAFPARGGLHLHYEISDLEWRPDQPLKLGDHRIEMTDFTLVPDEGPGSISIPKLVAEMNDVNPSLGWILDRFTLEKPEVKWTQSLEDLFIRPSQSPSSPAPASAPSKSLALLIQKLAISDATIDVQPTRLSPVIGSLQTTLDLQHLSIGAEGIQAEDVQKLRLDEVSLSLPDASGNRDEPLFKTTSAELEVTPSRLQEKGRIDKLTITNPEIRLTEKTAPWMKKASPVPAVAGDTTAAKVSTAPGVPSDEAPFWQRFNFAELEISNGKFEFATSGTGRVEAKADFALTTEPAPDADKDSPIHRLRLTDASGMVPDVAKLPIAGIQSIETAVRLPHLWRDRKIETLKIKGGQIEAGDALMSLFNGGSAIPEAPVPIEKAPTAPTPEAPAPAVEVKPVAPSASKKPKWKVGTIEVGDVAVTLQKLAPGLPSVRFEVNLQAQDTPLEMEQLAQHVVKQRVELSNLTIPSPYDPLRTVARLDTIFIDFTLDGVFAERLDKVEIVSPTLFVGEDLFWYVDYFRKYAAGEIKSAKDSPKLVSSDKAIALAAAKEISEAPAKKKGWAVDVLQVHSGKLVLAPKGVPLPGFGQPFPFSFITRLDDGRFDATLDIPPDTYTLPDLKLEFRGMQGKVEFNLPMKGVSNNLSEVFRVDKIRWKELHIEEAHMSLTYDMNGMYGQFGGAAYEGYLNGAFNIYFDQSYSWDGWIAASGIRTTEITEKMTPAYFVLNGKVDCKAVANGSSQELYQADLSFKNVTPGEFKVAGLNDMIKEYADYGTVDLTSQITRIGLETLRDFEYDTVDGEGRFYGREGKGFLRFKGPTGMRNFDINVLDHRWKDDPKKKPEEKDENPLAQP